ncbi:MAG: type II toxin-antitoxin system VapB family antitoxin [Proteobacteria bacterium]|nr:type II toxin-antitoxin system VapB family antitoxin [Pseudomonadota bacterium]
MISIANSRAEKAARKLAKHLHTTISEAVAVACERLLEESGQAEQAKRRRAQLDRVLAEIWKQHERPQSEAERARLADHRDLYGPDGLPR